MDITPQIAALIKKYPSLRKAIETGVEVLSPFLILSQFPPSLTKS